MQYNKTNLLLFRWVRGVDHKVWLEADRSTRPLVERRLFTSCLSSPSWGGCLWFGPVIRVTSVQPTGASRAIPVRCVAPAASASRRRSKGQLRSAPQPSPPHPTACVSPERRTCLYCTAIKLMCVCLRRHAPPLGLVPKSPVRAGCLSWM